MIYHRSSKESKFAHKSPPLLYTAWQLHSLIVELMFLAGDPIFSLSWFLPRRTFQFYLNVQCSTFLPETQFAQWWQERFKFQVFLLFLPRVFLPQWFSYNNFTSSPDITKPMLGSYWVVFERLQDYLRFALDWISLLKLMWRLLSSSPSRLPTLCWWRTSSLYLNGNYHPDHRDPKLK